MSAVIPFSRQGTPDVTGIVERTLATLRATVDEFERVATSRPRRRQVMRLDGTVDFEPLDEEYERQRIASWELAATLAIFNLEWQDKSALLSIVRHAENEGVASLEQALDELLRRHLSLDEHTTLAAGLLRRGATRKGRKDDATVARQDGRLATLLAELGADDGRLVLALAGALVEARLGKPNALRHALVNVIRNVLPRGDIARVIARLATDVVEWTRQAESRDAPGGAS